jgi:hypothetical protein
MILHLLVEFVLSDLKLRRELPSQVKSRQAESATIELSGDCGRYGKIRRPLALPRDVCSRASNYARYSC